jgi:hypothetical protein
MSAPQVGDRRRCDCCDLYKPLSPSQARVLCIGLAEGQAEPDISLRIVDLDDPGTGDFRQEYTAISYTWGDTASQASLPVRCGSGGVHNVTVSSNVIALVSAISRLAVRDVWVDQLSIDQTSDSEKASQIALMRTIYERARNVVIWLGNAEDDSDLAMDTLNAFYPLWLRRTNDYYAYQPGTNHLTRDSLELLLDSSNPASIAPWRAVDKLLRRPWWSRAWIVQEATANRELTRIVCGSRSIGLNVLDGLRDIYFAAATQSPPPGFEFLSRARTSFDTVLNINSFALARRRLPGGRPLLQLVSDIRPSQATDLRDKLWCMYGFAVDANTSVISPSGARSLLANQLYTSFAVWYLSTHRDLEILGHCATNAVNGLGLPSWVPDWSVRASCTCLPSRTDPSVRASAPIFLTSGHYKLPNIYTQASPDQPCALRLQGIKIAVVERSLAIPQVLTTADYTSGRAWRLYDTTNVLSLTGCSTDELLARTLVADCRRVYYNDRWDSHRIAATEPLSRIQYNGFNPYQLRRTVGGRALFRTQAGSTDGRVLLGLGPESMKCGDEVWLLKGGSVLYILRAHPAEPRRDLQVLDCSGGQDKTVDMNQDGKFYELVGEAFIHGLMDGELLGMMGEIPRRERPSPLKGMDRSFGIVTLI